MAKLEEWATVALLRAWSEETKFLSSSGTDHPIFPVLVEHADVKMLLKCLQRRAFGWKPIIVLRGVFKEEGPNVDDIAGRFEAIRERWLMWGKGKIL